MRAKMAALALVVGLIVACGSDPSAVPTATTSEAPPAVTPTPEAPTPTPTPVMARYEYGIDFRPVVGQTPITRVRTPRFNAGVRGVVDGGIHCYDSFRRFDQLGAVHLYDGGGRHLEVKRCGPAFPNCSDIGFTWTVEPGDYELEIERDNAWRWSEYHCDVTLTYPVR